MKLYTEKYGQVLLKDKNIAQIEISSLDDGESVLEIGPGEGVLTQFLLEKYPRVTVIESDHRFVEILRIKFFDYIEKGNLEVIHGDFLEYNGLIQDQIIGNVPYHISSKIVQKLSTMQFNKAILMLQSEFASTLMAKPSTKEYTRMTVFTYLNFNVELIKLVSRNSFSPVPGVDSAIISLRNKSKFPDIDRNAAEVKLRELFSQKRKKLKNVIENCPTQFQDSRIDQLMPEEIMNLLQNRVF
ncbi:MAG: 16S rRNA (adenine(1518)-N(6)/adenine(1519)-N(6))-dimethyltransferase RsmA [Candidatus Thermoplasmatota archaeon]|nr:16S rRNA (adenine(1518)-N(6)/adenine(1519)-N(6))-dimethyltransferase RsmA [Candidatus Thermoplasmatota archaeon]MCL5889232.1 16S rRNA (adenine(1518)-N(6)/adenine(1519)-N(6))-dimethyltransferase RsmA [Candidatus Thermoplasmatota archaeon]